MNPPVGSAVLLLFFFSPKKNQPLNSDFSAIWVLEFGRDKRIAESLEVAEKIIMMIGNSVNTFKSQGAAIEA